MSDPTNTVELTGSCIKNVTFVDGSLYVTGGEPSNPNPTVSSSGDTWSVSVTCNLEGSETTANKYNQQITAGGKYHELGLLSDASTYTPSKLNFFFQIEVTTKSSDGTELGSNKVWMGQGHTPFPFSRDNWWIGGMNMVYLDYNPSIALYLELNEPIPGQPIFIPMVNNIIVVEGYSSSSANHFNFSLCT